MTPWSSPMDVEIDYICDTCGRPVDDGEGALYVLHADIVNARTARAEWEKTTRGGPIDVVSLLTMGDSAPWRIKHDTCGALIADGYDISVEKVRTWRQLLSWTAQLMGKTWLPATDWAVVIEDAAEGRGRRIVEHVRDDAA